MKIRLAAKWEFNAAQAIKKFIIRAVLRTKTGVKPLLISIGYKIDLPSSIEWVVQCCQGYRLPEPALRPLWLVIEN